jgi:hypothetical protein
LEVDRIDQRSALVKLADPVETDSINPFKDVAIVTVLGSTAVPLDEPLYLLETSDDPLLSRRPASCVRIPG